MKKILFTAVATSVVAFAPGFTLLAQSYSNAVMALSPVAYWPLAESTAPDAAGQYAATNLGSAGIGCNGYYETWWASTPPNYALFSTNNIAHGAGAIVSDTNSASMVCGTVGRYLVFPRATNGVANPAVTLQPPFSVEFWVYIASTNSLREIMVEGGNNVLTGPEYGNAAAQEGIEMGYNKTHFYWKTYDGPGVAANSLTSADTLTTNTWHHVVFTFDGTVKQLYDNGVMKSTTLKNLNSQGQLFVPDLVSPLIFGNGNELGAGSTAVFDGRLAELAIYTNVLTPDLVNNHYIAGTTTSPTQPYSQTILDDNPIIYVRLNEPQFAGPTLASLPVATNYGSLGASADGVYQPGTAPGVAGPPYGGFGPSSLGVAISCFNGGVDVGGGNLPAELNPTNNQPFTVMTWFRGNPADAAARYQTLAGHGTNSWRLGLDLNPGNYFNPGAGPQLAFTNRTEMLAQNLSLNDGQWHFAAGVSDGTNDYLYLDGLLVKSGASVGSIPGNLQDVMLGGDPDYLAPQPSAPAGYRGGLFYDGSIAQVAFYTNALSTSQIRQLYDVAGVPPTLVQQPPSSLTTTSGYPVAISLVARGSALSYQWYRASGKAAAGQTTDTLNFNPVHLADQDSYYAVVTNSWGAVTSSVVQLTVIGAPVVQEQSPADVRVFAGTTPSLYVSAVGSPPIGYQWTMDTVPIAGATSTSYQPSTAATGTHLYSCNVTNIYSTNNPSPFNSITVTVMARPTAPYALAVLTDHPADYFRLDEGPDNGLGNNGLPAYDYAGGLNAIYTNALLANAGYDSLFSPQTDPTETAAQFGVVAPADSYAGNVPSFLSFATPNGTSAAFSVEAWVNGYNPQASAAGLVTLGYGNGGEQFCLDMGAGAAHNLRFFVRNAAGTTTAANGTTALDDGVWHHVVGVCDQPNGRIYLYVDGLQTASGVIATNSGLLNGTTPLAIGSRQAGSDTDYNSQFVGTLDDVALYNYALSPTQVAAHYTSAGVPPLITVQPSDITTNEGSTATLDVTVIGTEPLAYQWYDNASLPIPGATTSTLVLPNVQQSQSGSYYVIVTNLYSPSPVQSRSALLTVNSGPPMLVNDLQPPFYIGYAGRTFTYTVGVQGSGPFTYTWTRNGTVISGATGNSYTFTTLAGTNLYAVNIANAQNPTGINSSTVTNVGVAVPVLNPADYSYKARITFAGYNRPETLVNFPALIRFGTNLAGFAYNQLASPTGGDLRFTDATGTNEIPYEIDEWNPNGDSAVWVQVPTLGGPSDAIIAYWGNAAATTPPDWSTNGTVWLPGIGTAGGYWGVYHLKEGALPFADSTGQYPITDGVPGSAVPGIVNTGVSFDGASDYLSAGTIDLSNPFTLSAWINISPNVGNIMTVWASKPGAGTANGFAMNVNNFNTTDGSLRFITGNGTSTTAATSPAGSVTFGQWHLVTASVDTLANAAHLYVDGNEVTLATSVLSSFGKINEVQLGAALDGSWKFLGAMDEARIAQGTRSANWAWASYMTVAQNATLEEYSAVSGNRPVLGNMSFQLLSGNSLVLSGSGGPGAAGATYEVWATTNLALPMGSWTLVSSNAFDAGGNYRVTNTINPANPQQFFRIVAP